MTSLASTFAALANDSRLGILRILAEKTSLSSGEVAEALKTTHTLVARHLKILESAGLVHRSHQGLYTYQSLEPQGFEIPVSFLRDLQIKQERSEL
jgi:DNA-binding transcriptional ArsR family regulator